MSRSQPEYISYLLRLWSTKVDGSRVWRASLETPVTGQQQGFATLDDLFDFVRLKTAECNDRTRVKGYEVGDDAP